MKKTLREELLRKRDRIKPGEKKKKEAAIRKRLYASTDFRRAEDILFYASFRSEVDTMTTIKKTLTRGKHIVLPRVFSKEKILRLYWINDLSDLKPGTWGILEPDPFKCKEVDLDHIDVAIIPGAGFDTAGNRLGYGAGYYDKLFERVKKRESGGRGQGAVKKNAITPKPVLIALAFEDQIVRELPSEPHDVKMDKIITEKRTIDCNKNRGKGRACPDSFIGGASEQE